ncbi:MAG TPA: M20/M25/M40 family metallo-hydrolase [Streptosporangiaceae bacterium]|nr:M20/M25/M40 family metallo-hydrolase [Streptosporangiaceae bacterium]
MTGHPFVEAGRSRAPWMAERLAELVSCGSPSADPDALARCASLLDDMGAEVFGCAAQRFLRGGSPCLLWRGNKPSPVLLLGHFDTVWPAGTLTAWPYTVTDGIASGPGLFDMKGGIVQALAAVSLLENPDCVTLLITSDEETGSAASRALIEDQARSAAAVLVCEPSADGGAVKTARKGVGSYQFEVRGRAAHAGLEPHLGINAGIEVAHQVLALAGLADPAQETTVTPTAVAAETTANTIPERANLTVDVRAWTRAELERVDQQIRRLTPHLPDAALAVHGGINRYPLEAAAAAGLLALAQEAAAQIGLTPPIGVRSGGGSDGNLTAALGSPTLDGLGAVGGHPHARDEHTDTRAMPDRAALLAALITRINEDPARAGRGGTLS